MDKPRATHIARRAVRGNPRLTEARHDPYHDDTKLRGPTRCTGCGAIYLRGRWRWERLQPQPAATTRCPACRRIADRYPAGELTLSGAFVAAHRDELLKLVRNVEKSEAREHPLQRIMDIRRTGEELVITTTDVHLPRRIGHALENAWHGSLDTHYDEQGYFIRMRWERND